MRCIMGLFCCHFVVPSIHIILVEFIIMAIMLQNKSGSVNYGTQIVLSNNFLLRLERK